jgi:PII-like signaling protein
VLSIAAAYGLLVAAFKWGLGQPFGLILGSRFLADAFVEVYARHRLQTSLVMRGVEGFGAEQHLHTDRLLTLSEDLPLVAVAVDSRTRIEAPRLGIEALVDESVDLGERPGAANVGAKVMTLVSAMALGADCIDDCDLLRAGRTGQVLGHQVAAPSTLGTFLRAFTFGYVRQLDRVQGETLTRAWAAGAGRGEGRLVVDVDSFVGEARALSPTEEFTRWSRAPAPTVFGGRRSPAPRGRARRS